ncbi:unnamed protein product [Prorocentrum cordatum]|uniref:Uncharacterized protein n=1 Tax=Prorocentrum cordatum TaxID=2364126 RepID=A0ABN9T4K5_9DINO|nr:unnamed protein product [Polarella glacialis]
MLYPAVWLKENMPVELLHCIPRASQKSGRSIGMAVRDQVLWDEPFRGSWFSDVVRQHPDYCEEFCRSFKLEDEKDDHLIGFYEFIKSVRPDLATLGKGRSRQGKSRSKTAMPVREAQTLV